MSRSSMPPHNILDRDIEFYKGTMYSCREEFEYGTVSQYKSKQQLLREANWSEEECDPVIEQHGIWIRVTADGYDQAWHGPFDTVDAAWEFAERVWNPVKTGFRMSDDLDGVKKPKMQQKLPAWIRGR